jgi:hypothetical protein
VTFELRGTMELRFFGLARSSCGSRVRPGTCRTSPATCRRRSIGPGRQRQPRTLPGITRSPATASSAAPSEVNAEIARWLRLHARGGINFEQNRFLSDGRSGIAVLRHPGRRWHVEDARTWHLLTDASVGF